MIFIQGLTGLKPIISQLTKEEIVRALGYVPADGTNFYEDESGAFIIADNVGNIIAKIDDKGLTTTKANVEDVVLNGNSLNNKLDGIDDALQEAENHIANKVVHITAEERASWNEKATTGYVDTKISDLVGSAPEALNTLQELAKAIQDHEDVYAAYVETVKEDISKAKAEAIADAKAKDEVLKLALQAEIDLDVKTETDRAIAAERVLSDGLADEISRAERKESELLATINAEKKAREEAQRTINSEIDGLKTSLASTRSVADSALAKANSNTTEISTVKGRVEVLEGAGFQNASQVGVAIDNKITALNLPGTYDSKGAAANALTNAKTYVDGAIKDRVVALTRDEILSHLV